MNKRIKIALVDDDPCMHDILTDLYLESEQVTIKYHFTDPKEFIKQAPMLDFDLCLLDISMPQTDGLTVAQLLKNKSYIFITGSEDRLKDALGLESIDVVTKPFNKERLDRALDKAIKLIGDKIEYALFNVAECKRKISIHLPDILFVSTDDIDPRNKQVVLKNLLKYTLMDCSLEEILKLALHLVQVNRRELIALDNINEVAHDIVSVKSTAATDVPKELTLGSAYKNTISKRVFFK